MTHGDGMHRLPVLKNERPTRTNTEEKIFPVAFPLGKVPDRTSLHVQGAIEFPLLVEIETGSFVALPNVMDEQSFSPSLQ